MLWELRRLCSEEKETTRTSGGERAVYWIQGAQLTFA